MQEFLEWSGRSKGREKEWTLPGELNTARKSNAENSVGGGLSSGRGGASNGLKSRMLRLSNSSEMFTGSTLALLQVIFIFVMRIR